MKTPVLLSLLSISFLLLFSCGQAGSEEQPTSEEKLGVIDFRFTGSATAQPIFKKGLLLLHNFEYADARAAFLEAQQTDSTMLMAYWGEAMTYNHPLWREQDYEAGKAALEKFGSDAEKRRERAATAVEKDWLEAVEILYGEGDKKDRDRLYNQYLESLYGKYPEDHEVAAFYALSCLGAGISRDEQAYEKGAAIAQGIIDENPNHPGALHYLIHSYDDPGHAPLALKAANNYSKVAADAAHALHMPSHIYVAVGMWDEVVKSNIASWNASVNRMESKELDGNARSYHAFHWWLYGLLQKGQYGEATRLMKLMDEYIDEESSKGSRTYLVRMKGNYLVETGKWDSPVSGYEVKMDDLNIVGRSTFDYLEGVKAFRKGDLDRLNEVLEQMAKRRSFAETLVSESGAAMCNAAGSDRFAPNRTDINQALIMEMELRALRSWTEIAEAEDWLKQATALEEKTSYAYGPPVIVQPSFELYGQWLLENGRAEDASRQFDIALDRGPRRVAALKGKIDALKLLGKNGEVTALQKELMDVLKDADQALIEKLQNAKQLTTL